MGDFAHNLTDEERLAILLAVPDYGRVTTKGSEGSRDGRTIVIDFYPHLKGGQRYLQSAGGKAFPTEERAETILLAVRQRAQITGLETAVNEFRSSRAKGARVTGVIERYFAAVESGFWQSPRTGRAPSPRTIAAYRRVLRRAEPYFEGLTWAELMDSRRLAHFKAWFRAPEPDGRGLLSDQETRNCFAALRAVVAWYEHEHPGWTRPQFPPIPTAARAKRENEAERSDARQTLPETVAAIEALPENRRPIFWAMLYTQARPTEARGILCGDYRAPRLTVRRSAEGDHSTDSIAPRTKTGERGFWELPGWLCALIERVCSPNFEPPERPLFRNPDPQARGELFSYDALRDAWMGACEAAGVPYVPVYRALKHGIVTAYLDAGMEVDDVIAQCRFKGDAMVEVYDLDADRRRQGNVERLDEWVRKAKENGS